jgi:hypothetical protein
MDKRLVIIVLSLLAASTVAYADIYKCADETGQVAFADARTKSGYSSCKLVLRDESNPAPVSTATSPSGMRAINYTKSASPADFPKVDRQTQTLRDDKRKQILLSELESEQKALQDAKLQHLIADLDSHEKNIGLLQKELSAFR